MKAIATALALSSLLVFSLPAAVIQVENNSIGAFVTTNGTDTQYNLGSLTVGNNSNRMLVIALSHNGTGFGDFTEISGISYGNQSFTRQILDSDQSTRVGAEIWTLASPNVGSSEQISLTLDSANDQQAIGYGVLSLHNVDLTDPFIATTPDDISGDNKNVQLTYELGPDTVNPFYFETGGGNSNNGWVLPNNDVTALINGNDDGNSGVNAFVTYQSVEGQSGEVSRFYGQGPNNNAEGAGIALRAIPEPSANLLILSALGLLAMLRRRRGRD